MRYFQIVKLFETENDYLEANCLKNSKNGIQILVGQTLKNTVLTNNSIMVRPNETVMSFLTFSDNILLHAHKC